MSAAVHSSPPSSDSLPPAKLPKRLSPVEKAILTLQEAIEVGRRVRPALDTICMIANQNEHSKRSLNSSGAFELTIRALGRSDDDSGDFFAIAIKAIGDLGINVYSRKINCVYSALNENERIKCSSEVILTALNRFPMHEKVLISICTCIWKLSSSIEGAQALGRSGAGDAIIAILSRNLDHEIIAKEACFAMGILASWDSWNSKYLGEIGACGLSVTALRAYASNERVTEIVLEAISYLAKDQCENQQILLSLGICEVILDTVSQNKDSVSVVWFSCHLFLDLYYVTKEQKSFLVQKKGLSSSGQVLTKSLHDFYQIWNPDEVVKQTNRRRRRAFVRFLNCYVGSPDPHQQYHPSCDTEYGDSKLIVFSSISICRRVLSFI